MNHSSLPVIPFTKEAFDKIKSKIAKLSEERKAVLVRLQTAREMGDLSENGAYKYAKFELGNVSRQLRELNYLARFGKVTPKDETGKVGFGNQVTLETNTHPVTYTLVSQYESNPSENKLSMESPIGQALMGKTVGDTVTVTIPKGEIVYTVKEIN